MLILFSLKLASYSFFLTKSLEEEISRHMTVEFWLHEYIPWDDCCVLNVACCCIQLFSVTNSYEYKILLTNSICTCFVACDTDVCYTWVLCSIMCTLRAMLLHIITETSYMMPAVLKVNLLCSCLNKVLSVCVLIHGSELLLRSWKTSPEIHYWIYKSKPLDPLLLQIKQSQVLTRYLW